MIRQAAFLVALLLSGCGGKRVGDSCKGTVSTCATKTSAIACHAGKYVAVECKGPLACSKFEDHANCDTSVASPGEPCMGEDDEYACTADKKRALVCKGGKYDVHLDCRGASGCSILGRSVSCDVSVAQTGDPCKTQGAAACSVDQKEMLSCRDGKFGRYRYCRGQYGCAANGDTPSCDESISLAGDPCGIPGRVVCSLDGKNELICQGGTYTPSLTCKAGCVVTNRPGRPIDCH